MTRVAARRSSSTAPTPTASGSPASGVRQVKKEVIETEGLGLLEYVEPKYDLVDGGRHAGGQGRACAAPRAPSRAATRRRCRWATWSAARWGAPRPSSSSASRTRSASPCVKLKNFRSMWVGSTEANLERILKILAVADPGRRGDRRGRRRARQPRAGAATRAPRTASSPRSPSFMGDTRNRGKILWFLITARPDLLPIDLKRQGRAEEHIPLFYPETVGRVRRDLPGDAARSSGSRPRSTTLVGGRRRGELLLGPLGLRPRGGPGARDPRGRGRGVARRSPPSI